MTRSIEITVSPDGKARIETKGFIGSDCRQASKFVEQALGQTLGEKLTNEFYASAKVEQPMREKQ